MEVQFKFEGDKQLKKKLESLNRTARGRALRKAAKAGAEEVVKEAKRRVPVDTGKTQKHIRSWFTERKSESVTVAVGVTAKSRVHVARFLETGTSKMAARPFLRPAIEEKQRQAVEATHETMVEEVLEEAKKGGR